MATRGILTEMNGEIMKSEADLTTPPDQLLPDSVLLPDPAVQPEPVLKTGITTAKRVLFLGGATACLGLGLVGIVIPGLPATPFLLLSSFLLVRSFPQLNDMLLRSRLFGPILRDWHERRGIRRRVKFRSILIVVASIAITCYFSSLSVPLLAIIIAAGFVGVVVIMRLPEI